MINVLAREVRKGFQQKIAIHIEHKRYIVKTAESVDEVLSALSLRHEVFYQEGLGRSLFGEIDLDEFDIDADHLLVVDKLTRKVVGNYRLRSSLFTEKFYTQTEFEISNFLAEATGEKLEMGRACVAKDHRNGVVIQLLWRGVMEYLQITNTRYLFGCSSVSARESGLVQSVWNHILRRELLHNTYDAYPLIAFDLAGADEYSEVQIPSLLSSYVRYGARIIAAPAYDREFECADFLTVMDTQQIKARRFNQIHVQENLASLRPISATYANV